MREGKRREKPLQGQARKAHCSNHKSCFPGLGERPSKSRRITLVSPNPVKHGLLRGWRAVCFPSSLFSLRSSSKLSDGMVTRLFCCICPRSGARQFVAFQGHAYDPDAIIGLKSFPGDSSLSFPSPGSGSLKLYEEAGGHPEALKNEKK